MEAFKKAKHELTSNEYIIRYSKLIQQMNTEEFTYESLTYLKQLVKDEMLSLKKPAKKINPKKDSKENQFNGMTTDEIYHAMSESEITYQNYLNNQMKGEYNNVILKS